MMTRIRSTVDKQQSTRKPLLCRSTDHILSINGIQGIRIYFWDWDLFFNLDRSMDVLQVQRSLKKAFDLLCEIYFPWAKRKKYQFEQIGV